MYYNVKICRADKSELENLLDRYVKKDSKQMSVNIYTCLGDLQAIKNDLDLIIRIREALESAEKTRTERNNYV